MGSQAPAAAAASAVQADTKPVSAPSLHGIRDPGSVVATGPATRFGMMRQTKAKTRKVAKRTSEAKACQERTKPAPHKQPRPQAPALPGTLEELVDRKFQELSDAARACSNPDRGADEDADVLSAAYKDMQQELNDSLYYVAKSICLKKGSERGRSPGSADGRGGDDDEDDEQDEYALDMDDCTSSKPQLSAGDRARTSANADAVTVDLNASLRRRVEKKKRKLEDIKDRSVVKVASLTRIYKNDAKETAKEELRRYYEQIAKERFEQRPSSNAVCPLCPGSVPLEERERPPAKVCTSCGFSVDLWDAAETEGAQAVGYRAKQHFMGLVNRVRVKQKHKIPDDVYDAVYAALDKMGITDVSKVTVNTVDGILRSLSRTVDQRFTPFYGHVYQITNKIRGAPIVVITEDQVRQLDSLFDLTFDTWKLIKPKDRLNFLASSFVLRMFLGILGFPPNIIEMVSIIKGVDNIRHYNVMCRQICDIHGWNYTPVSDIQSVNNGSLARIIPPVTGPAAPPRSDAVTPPVKSRAVAEQASQARGKAQMFPSWAIS